MTTLRTYYADEIASALDKQLKDKAFVGLYKRAQTEWWKKGPTALAYKTEIDQAQEENQVIGIVNKYLGGGELTTKLGQEGIDDHTELREYAGAKIVELKNKQPQAAKDGCSEHAEARDGCPQCADGGLAIAIDFTIKHMVKIADALDQTGFTNVAEILDETLRKLAAQRPLVVIAKKKQKGRSYKEWVTFFGKKGPKVVEKFRKTYKGALEHAKEKGMKKDKAEEYAMRTSLDKMPKSYFKEPTPEHGPGKSGPLVTKRSK